MAQTYEDRIPGIYCNYILNKNIIYVTSVYRFYRNNGTVRVPYSYFPYCDISKASSRSCAEFDGTCTADYIAIIYLYVIIASAHLIRFQTDAVIS